MTTMKGRKKANQRPISANLYRNSDNTLIRRIFLAGNVGWTLHTIYYCIKILSEQLLYTLNEIIGAPKLIAFFV